DLPVVLAPRVRGLARTDPPAGELAAHAVEPRLDAGQGDARGTPVDRVLPRRVPPARLADHGAGAGGRRLRAGPVPGHVRRLRMGFVARAALLHLPVPAVDVGAAVRAPPVPHLLVGRPLDRGVARSPRAGPGRVGYAAGRAAP